MKAVLFDLDGTLLDVDMSEFLPRYFAALQRVLAELPTSMSPAGLLDAVLAATTTMTEPHPGVSNQDAFEEDFRALTGIDLDDHRETFSRFYGEQFPLLGDGAGPKPGARDAVTRALDLGLRVVIATNPIFPRAAIDHRIAWAGLSDLPFDVVTSYEIMHACKPLPQYFSEVAAMLGTDPRDCLMVGDDPRLDLPASATGMSTFFVGRAGGESADRSGSLHELAALLGQ